MHPFPGCIRGPPLEQESEVSHGKILDLFDARIVSFSAFHPHFSTELRDEFDECF